MKEKVAFVVLAILAAVALSLYAVYKRATVLATYDQVGRATPTGVPPSKPAAVTSGPITQPQSGVFEQVVAGQQYTFVSPNIYQQQGVHAE